jgi:Flp pilus assembly protein TadD
MIAYAETEGGIGNERKLMEAKNHIDELRLNNPIASDQEEKVAALIKAGLAHLHDARFTEAIRVFQEAARGAPGESEILGHLGDAYLRNGDLVEAQRTLLQALVLVPGQAQAWINLGQTYARIGNLTAAVACFANAYRFSPKREETRQVLQNLAAKEESAIRDTATQALQLQFLRLDGHTTTKQPGDTLMNESSPLRE